MIVQPLYGYVSPETAYLVDDYPYGARARCRIRYWLEDAKHGYRFCSQTENPSTLRWNNPRKSTYARFAACMYLDENGHVQWLPVSEYTDARNVLAFVKGCPGADLRDLAIFSKMKLAYAEKGARGEIVWQANGVPQPVRPEEIERYRDEVALWREVVIAIRRERPPVTVKAAAAAE